jgi:tetratricopeptide (TPR) repeat protein
MSRLQTITVNLLTEPLMKINIVIWVSLIVAALFATQFVVASEKSPEEKGAWEIRAASSSLESSPGTGPTVEAEPRALLDSEQSSESKEGVLDGDKESSAALLERSPKGSANDQVVEESKEPSKPVAAPLSQTESVDETNAIESPKTSSQMERESPAESEPDEEEKSNVEAIAEQKREKRRLSNDLEQQFKALRRSLETEDAFSLQLAEDYFGYGKLLRESGELEEALDAYINALHIQKINHGIYAPEQRLLLKELFETHYQLGNVDKYEDYLERILWVEKKNPDLDDDFSFQMQLDLGNQYLDEYLGNPTASSRKVETLLRAKGHLRAAVRSHKHRPLEVNFLPYGELALIGYLENRILGNVDETSYAIDPRLKRSEDLSGNEHVLISYLGNPFASGKAALGGYLKKATDEENLDHIVGALIALGDYHQLFKKNQAAIRFYKLAWKAGEKLPDGSLRLQEFSTVTTLPSFEYAKKRVPIIPNRPSILVPVKITLHGDGRVKEVGKLSEDNVLIKFASRARRAAKNLVFRPSLIDGELSDEQEIDYQIRVYARKNEVLPDV